MTIKASDHDALTRAIAWMRQRSPACAAQIADKLERDGFEAAGAFAAYHAQREALGLHPCQCPPCVVGGSDDPDPYRYGRRPREIELRDAMLGAGHARPDFVTMTKTDLRPVWPVACLLS
jgi:hypothetical protein